MTSTDVAVAAATCPALLGRDPLGFLAALGALRILTNFTEVRLSWEPVTTQARLTGIELDEAVALLAKAIADLGDDGLAVGMPAGLIASGSWESGPDPTHKTPEEFRAAMERAQSADERRWIRALWTDLAMDDKAGNCSRTPFFAPTGKQSMRTLFEKPAEAVRGHPKDRMSEALLSWRRVRGYTGENLDIRALRQAAEQGDGKATTYGVPGATWLAINALPLFPMGGDGKSVRTVGWHRAVGGGRRRFVFAWPVWRKPLSLEAVAVLLRHPLVGKAVEYFFASSSGGQARASGVWRRGVRNWRDQADALDVDMVCIAERWAFKGAKSAGYLRLIGEWR